MDRLRLSVLPRAAPLAAPHMTRRLRILALEPYYGGSHRAVLDGLGECLDAEWTLLTLPARKWKWRMRGAAITMAAEARRLAGTRELPSEPDAGGHPAPWDLVFASTFVNLAEFRGLVGPAIAGVPAIVYFHENQLVYPNRHTAEWDFQFPLTNITSALSAECCLFNTEWNLREFVREIPLFLGQFPDHPPRGVAQAIAEKSRVLPPPFDPVVFDSVGAPTRGTRVRIVWPHRWEHDKNPEEFFAVVGALAEEGLDFEVAVAGQAFKDVPDAIRSAEGELGDRLVHIGEPQSRESYARLLASADIAVSTARNEFFGIAMIEAAYAGCYPLVPDRLAYPDIYPPEMRYDTADDLAARLREFVGERPLPGLARGIAKRFTFDEMVPDFTAVFARVAALGRT